MGRPTKQCPAKMKSGDSWLTHNPHVCDNINAHDAGVYKTNKC